MPVLGPGRFPRAFPTRGKRAAARAGALPRPFPWWRTDPAPIARGRFCVSGVRVGLGRVAGSSRCLGRRASHGLPRRRKTASRSSRRAIFAWPGSGGGLAASRVSRPAFRAGMFSRPFPPRGKRAAVWAEALPTAFLGAEKRPPAHRAGPSSRGRVRAGAWRHLGFRGPRFGPGCSHGLPRRVGNALLFGPGASHGLPRRRKTAPRSARGAGFAWPGFGLEPWPWSGFHGQCLGRDGSRLLPRRAGKALLFGPRRFPRPFPWRRNGPALGIGTGPGSFLAAKERPRAQRAGPVLRGQVRAVAWPCCGFHAGAWAGAVPSRFPDAWETRCRLGRSASTAFPVAKERPRAHRAGPVCVAGFGIPRPALRAGFPRLPLSRPAPRPATLPRRASARGMA